MDTIILYTLIVFQLSNVEGHPHKTTHYDVPENRIDYLIEFYTRDTNNTYELKKDTVWTRGNKRIDIGVGGIHF